MQFPLVSTVLALGATAALTLSFAPAQGGGEMDMAAMMQKAEPYMKPGEHHKVLERFVGKWNTEARMFMGGQATPPERGTSEISWLMAGRWIQIRGKGSMMGMPLESFYLLGYDNFKMSYVCSGVTNFDTAMVRFEGDMTPDGKAIVSYGTVDEYMTGEHDKMSKCAWRFLDADTLVMEVHDFAIGEVDTKVFEIKYMRAK